MAENHNRPTKHQHRPDTCQWLGCKGIDAIIDDAFLATREIVKRELETENIAPVMDFRMRVDSNA